MSGLVALAVVAALVALVGVAGVARGRVRRHGFLVLLWRWLTGHPWHGKPVTDAGWFRPGRKALTRTGHASRWSYMPRYRRTLWRSGGAVGVVLGLYGYSTHHRITLAVAAAVAALGAVYGAVRLRRAWRGRKHHRTWTEPLHVALAPLLGVPLPNRPESWLQVEQDRSRAVVQLPAGFRGDAKDKDTIAATVTAKLGIEAPDVQWSIAGPSPTLTLTRSEPPPDKVGLADVQDAIEAAAVDELVLGIGKAGAPVTVSLSGDSPHVGLSMGTGAGKSVCGRLVGAQMLHRGGVTAVLDIKRISHTWARGLPNTAIAKGIDEIHNMLLWLAGELDRRNEVADVAADLEGVVHANVGASMLIIVEEINFTQQRLRAYWKSIREPGDPTRSPAAEALDQLLFAGRQARMHCLVIGQRLSAAASGSGDARENLACRILGRHSASTWKMLCPEFPFAPASRKPGRVQVVDDRVRECQVAYLTGRVAHDFALSGTVTACPPGMPYTTRIAGETAAALIDVPAPDLGVKQIQPVPVSPQPTGVTLAEAKEQGLLSGTLAGVRTARHRHPDAFPQPVGQRGLAKVYDPDQLAAWDEARRHTP